MSARVILDFWSLHLLQADVLAHGERHAKPLPRKPANRQNRLVQLDDPRALGEHAGYWRWRIRDYRVVARIEDARVLILVVRVGHWR